MAGILGGGASAGVGVRPDGVVVAVPGRQRCASVSQRGEQRVVEAAIAQVAVEALHEGILRRLAGCDVRPLDLPFLRPSHDGGRDELGVIVADTQEWFAALTHQRLQPAYDTGAGQWRVCHQGWALLAEVIDRRQDTEASVTGNGVGHEDRRSGAGLAPAAPLSVRAC